METIGLFLSQLITGLLILLGQILPTAFGIAALAIAPKVYSWVNGLAKALKTRTSESQYQLLILFIEQAIRAAHQSGLIGQIEADGQAKKRFAIDLVERLLKQYGIEFDVDVIADAIEGEIKRVLADIANEQARAQSANDYLVNGNPSNRAILQAQDGQATVTVETTVTADSVEAA